MGRGRHITPEVESFIVLELKSGTSYDMIIKELGVSYSTIYRIAKRYNIIRKKHIQPNTKNCIIEDARIGMPYKMIGEHYGVSNKYVSQLALKNGIRKRGVRNDKKPM